MHATDETEFSIQLKNGRLTTFEARDTTYHDAVRILAILAGERVEILSAPKEPLFVRYNNRTPKEAFEAILRSSVLTVERRGGVYRVTARK
jgi:hypothetical protein